MSHSARGIISESFSGSVTREQTTRGQGKSTRTSGENLRDATSQMWRNVKGIPSDIQNIVYGFTSEKGRYKESLVGPWPRLSESLAKAGAPFVDVMAPVMEHGARLKREFYFAELPPLEAIEAKEADDECRLHKAEILHDPNAVKEAARAIAADAELLSEVADRELHGSTK